MLFRSFFLISISLVLISCSNKEPIYKPSEKINPFIVYEEGYAAFKKNNFFSQIQNF